MAHRIGIIASPESAGVYRHAILAGFLLDADVRTSSPEAGRIAAALLSWEAAGVTCAVVDEGSYPGNAIEQIIGYLSLSPNPIRIILSASRMRTAGDSDLSALEESGLFGVVGSWDNRPAVKLKQLLLAATDSNDNTRPRQAAQTRYSGSTDEQAAGAGTAREADEDACLEDGSFDACIPRLKHGGVCRCEWCPRMAVAGTEPEIIYDEPQEPSAIVFIGAGLQQVIQEVREDAAPEDWEELVAELVDAEDEGNAYIMRDLIVYAAKARTEAPSGRAAAKTTAATKRKRTNQVARFRLRRVGEVAKDILVAAILSLVASFVLTMFLNPTMGSFEILELFRDRAIDLLRFIGFNL